MTPDQHSDIDAALLAYWTARDEARLANNRVAWSTKAPAPVTPQVVTSTG